MGRRRLTQPTLKPYANDARPEYKWRVFYLKEGGARTASVFKTKQEAQNFLQERKAAAENLGSEVSTVVTDDLKRTVFDATLKLAPFKKTISDAVDFYVKHLESIKRSRPISELIEDFLDVKRRAGKSERYLYDLEFRLGKFSEDHGKKFACEISTPQAQRWLSKTNGGALSRNHYRTTLGTFFSWCNRNGYTETNPVVGTEKSKVDQSKIEIFTVDQLKTVIKAAQKLADKDILAQIVIQAFAGLRYSEAERLHWEDVKLEQGIIDLKGTKTKSARRRVVIIQPVLRYWLERYFADAKGRILHPSFQNRLKKFRNDLKAPAEDSNQEPIIWPHNALRHSFASYLLSETNDIGFVSLQLGHQDPSVLFNHYRELVATAEAERYWKLAPKQAKKAGWQIIKK